MRDGNPAPRGKAPSQTHGESVPAEEQRMITRRSSGLALVAVLAPVGAALFVGLTGAGLLLWAPMAVAGMRQLPQERFAAVLVIGLWPSLLHWLTEPAARALMAAFGG